MFQYAKSPVLPYTFALGDIAKCEDAAEVGEQTLTNKITNEEMSVRKFEIEKTAIIQIKRAVKRKKN